MPWAENYGTHKLFNLRWAFFCVFCCSYKKNILIPKQTSYFLWHLCYHQFYDLYTVLRVNLVPLLICSCLGFTRYIFYYLFIRMTWDTLLSQSIKSKYTEIIYSVNKRTFVWHAAVSSDHFFFFFFLICHLLSKVGYRGSSNCCSKDVYRCAFATSP